MSDRPPPAAPARVPPKPLVSGALALAAVISAAVAVQAPRTAVHEGTIYRSYRDQGGKWTACNGHTARVGPNMTFTKAQCDAFLKTDLAAHTAAVVHATPTLAEQPSALQSAGDFAFNAGDGWWNKSPMAAQFAKRHWRAGCEAFRGFITLYRAPKPIAGQRCFRKANGALYCEAKGLVARRERERTVCLSGLKL